MNNKSQSFIPEREWAYFVRQCRPNGHARVPDYISDTYTPDYWYREMRAYHNKETPEQYQDLFSSIKVVRR